MKRLQKFISECGICSRRKAEELISLGRVTVNGEVVTEMGYKIIDEDKVTVDGKIIKQQKKIYVMLNKPKGYITSVCDDRERPTVTELVADIDEKLFPVGRLDYNTEGLLILTSDGEFANKLIHPSGKINKTYVARLNRNITEEDISMLLNGVEIDDYTAVATKLKSLDKTKKVYSISIQSGKNRQVRKMFEAVNAKVLDLKRISIGELFLGKLETGKYRYLTAKEIEYVNKAI